MLTNMPLIIKEGNLLEAKENIIAHQVNCQGKMSSGVALQIKEKYPRAFSRYRELYNDVEDKKELMGLCQLSIVEGSKGRPEKIVANLFAQYQYGRMNKVYTDYHALAKALQKLHDIVINPENYYYGCTIAIPYKMGCGLGGGDWDIVSDMLNGIFHDIDIVAYKMEEIASKEIEEALKLSRHSGESYGYTVEDHAKIVKEYKDKK